jgi:uncharacterized protein YhbP (UPF0306 family)
MKHDIQALIQEVLEKGYLMSLATHDDGGVWAAVVIYFSDGLNIYWMSDPDVRHSKAILHNPKVAGAITASTKGEKNLGLQFEGIAEKIEGVNYDLAKKYYAKKGKLEPKEDDDVLEGDSWYVIKPSKIQLIHEEHFGFKKHLLEL